VKNQIKFGVVRSIFEKEYGVPPATIQVCHSPSDVREKFAENFNALGES
jgi:hypothetical protein